MSFVGKCGNGSGGTTTTHSANSVIKALNLLQVLFDIFNRLFFCNQNITIFINNARRYQLKALEYFFTMSFSAY